MIFRSLRPSKEPYQMLNDDFGIGYSISNNKIVFDSDYVSARAALKYSDIYAVVNKLAEDMASVHFEVNNTFTNKVLTNPSSTSNQFSFWRSMYVQMLLSGNAYALIWGDKSGRSDHLEYLKPSQVQIFRSGDGNQISYDVTFPETEEADIKNVPSAQMIHLKTMSIDGGLIGVSPLRALTKELQLQDANKGLALGAMKNGLNITGLLKIQKGGLLDGHTKEGTRKAFEKQAENGHVVVLDALEEYQPLEVNKDISRLLSSTDWTSNQIAKVYGVPQDYLGSESEHSNIEMISIQYAQTIGRYIRGVVSELQKKLNGNITYDINAISDIDGQHVENRVRGLVKDRVISAELAQNILLRSNSDLLTVDDIKKTKNPLPPISVQKMKGGDKNEQGTGTESD
ncbi:phage portal protein [Companilactobacillus jidongensis]|uniref:phage portal protein n=1 Tax=Companilactobacillus jidongensis TaxID=2486006 RepID=UPI000F7A1EC1|nr:phage portal protein [Companilactobacillus jidongensis]